MTSEHQKMMARRVAMLFIGFAHLGLAVLAMTDRLNFTVPPEYRLLQRMADNQMWLFIHMVAFVVLVISLQRNRHQISTLSFSAGFMGVWAFFNLLWGLNAVSPVSLAGPILGMAVAGLAYSVAMSWATGVHDRSH